MTDPQTPVIRVEEVEFQSVKMARLEAEVTRLTQELAETHRCWDETNSTIALYQRDLAQAEADLLVCQQEKADLQQHARETIGKLEYVQGNYLAERGRRVTLEQGIAQVVESMRQKNYIPMIAKWAETLSRLMAPQPETKA